MVEGDMGASGSILLLLPAMMAIRVPSGGALLLSLVGLSQSSILRYEPPAAHE
jgi:hypothetical protein